MAIESGALDGIPVVGLFTGILRASRDIGERWRFQKLVSFLFEIEERSSIEDRQALADRFQNEKQREEFGGALLVLVERAEDIEKPNVLGRLLAAHAKGAFGRDQLLRMSRMVDRCFFEDLQLLKDFRAGLQRGRHLEAQCLAAVGFLQQTGADGGIVSDPESGGLMYDINELGRWVAQYGLADEYRPDSA